MCYMPRLSILLHLIARTILGQYRPLSSSLCNFLHYPVTSFLLHPNILLSTLRRPDPPPTLLVTQVVNTTRHKLAQQHNFLPATWMITEVREIGMAANKRKPNQTKIKQIWCGFDRASSILCGNKMPTRCNRWIFIADLIACSTCFGHHYAHHQELEYYTSGCCLSYLVLGFHVVGMVWSWGLCVWFAGLPLV